MSNVNIIGGDVNDSKISDRKEVHVPNSNTSTTSHNGNKPIQESNTTTYPTASVPPFTMHSDQYFMPPYTNPLGNLGLNTNSRQRPNSNQPRYSQYSVPSVANSILHNTDEESVSDYGRGTEELLEHITQNPQLREEIIKRILGGSNVARDTDDTSETSLRFARPTLKAPSSFSGEYMVAGNPNLRELSAEEWCDEMENYMRLNNRSLKTDTDKLDFARTYLAGAALQFFRAWHNFVPAIENLEPLGKPQGFSTWASFRSRLISQFQPLNSGQYIRDQMKLIPQGNKTVGQYVNTYRSLMLRIPSMKNDERIWKFREGLHPTIKEYVDGKILDKGPTITLEDVIQIALTHEAHLLHQRALGNKNSNYNPINIGTSNTNYNYSNYSTRGIPKPMLGGNKWNYGRGRGGYHYGGYAYGRGGYNQYPKQQYSTKSVALTEAKGQLANMNLDMKTEADNNMLANGNEGEEASEYENYEAGQSHLYAVTSASSSSASSSPYSGPVGPCYECNKMGHIARDCWYSAANQGRGRGRGGYRGRGRSRGRGNGRGGAQGNLKE